MKVALSISLFSLMVGSVTAFRPSLSAEPSRNTFLNAEATTASAAASSSSSSSSATQDPLLIRAARGEVVERTPVWMMRQAGRHMKCYRDLCQTYPTFRQRSEITDVAVEISLQPYHAYQTDGCILFSDILTPLPGMGANFEIDERLGPVMEKPIETWDDMKMVRNRKG